VIEQSVEVTYPRLGACVVTVYGDQDRGSAEEFERQLANLIERNELVVLDVSEAEFVDSSFLRNVLVADRRANEQAKRFRLQMGTAPVVRRAFEVSGVLDRLEVVGSREAALQGTVEAWEAPDSDSPDV
jgi:anti-anti-sigma factor